MKYRHYSPTAPVTLLDVHLSLQNGVPKGDREGERGPVGQDVERVRAAAARHVVRLVQEVVHVVVEQTDRHQNTSLPSEATMHDKHGESSVVRVTENCEVAVQANGMQHAKTGEVVLKVGVLRTTKGPGVPQGLSKGDQSSKYEVSHQLVEVVEYVLGDFDAPVVVARELFLALRLMDELGVSAIVAEGVREGDEGFAVMNRLRKAASRVVALDPLDT